MGKHFLHKVIILITLIVLGILTKFYSGFGCVFVQNHLGGVVYVIFWIYFFSLIFYNNKPIKLTLWVFAITCLIEFTQLFHFFGLDKLREYFIIQALIGNTFNPYDFIWYLVGASVGLSLQIFNNKNSNPTTNIDHK